MRIGHRKEILTSHRIKVSSMGVYKHNETTHVVKTFIQELDVSYAPTYIFRGDDYLNYN